MTKTTKILLAVSLISFAMSLTGVLWGLFLPVGAIFFGLFMVFNVLAKEMAVFDEEQRLRFAQAEKNSARISDSQKADPTRALRAATSH